MTIELLFIILLGILVLVFLGISLHQASNNEKMRRYIKELERDLNKKKK
jgi:hypothetical protein